MTRRPLANTTRIRITSKGQVTVPRALRERFGITRETELRFVAERAKLVPVKGKAIGSPAASAAGETEDPTERRPEKARLSHAVR